MAKGDNYEEFHHEQMKLILFSKPACEEKEIEMKAELQLHKRFFFFSALCQFHKI